MPNGQSKDSHHARLFVTLSYTHSLSTALYLHSLSELHDCTTTAESSTCKIGSINVHRFNVYIALVSESSFSVTS